MTCFYVFSAHLQAMRSGFRADPVAGKAILNAFLHLWRTLHFHLLHNFASKRIRYVEAK
jgi:hypothetical protein